MPGNTSCNYHNIIPVIISRRGDCSSTPFFKKIVHTVSNSSNRNNLLNINPKPFTQSTTKGKYKYVPIIFLSDLRSLVLKIDEIRLLVSQINPDLILLMETWMRDTIGINQIAIHNYNILRRDPIADSHGDVCLYKVNTIKFNRLNHLEDDNLKVLSI